MGPFYVAPRGTYNIGPNEFLKGNQKYVISGEEAGPQPLFFRGGGVGEGGQQL